MDVGPDTEQTNPGVGRSPQNQSNGGRADQMWQARRAELTAEWNAFSFEVQWATLAALELDARIMTGFMPHPEIIFRMNEYARIEQYNRGTAAADSHSGLVTFWQEVEAMATTAEIRIDTQKSRYDHFLQQAGTSFWGGAETMYSEWLGDTELPELSLYSNAQRCIYRLRSKVSQADPSTIDGVQRTLSSTEHHVNRWVEAMNSYIANREDSGDRAVQHLTWTRDGAFTALAVLATGGVTAAVGAEAVGAKMLISGGVAVATGVTKGTVVQGAEIQAGLRSEWDVAAIARSAVISGVASFLASGLGTMCFERLVKKVGVAAISRFGEQAGVGIERTVKSILTGPLKPTFTAFLEYCGGQEGITPDEFAEQWMTRSGSQTLAHFAMSAGGLH